MGGQSHGRERQDMAYGSLILRVTFSWHVYFPLRFFCSPLSPRHPTFTYPDPPLKLCISGPWHPVPSQTIRLSLCVTVSSLKEGAAFALHDDHHCHQCRYYDHHIHRGPKIPPFRRLHYQQQPQQQQQQHQSDLKEQREIKKRFRSHPPTRFLHHSKKYWSSLISFLSFLLS